MRRCCARCLRPVDVVESQAYVNGKVLHLRCTEYDAGGIVEPHGPLATDNVEAVSVYGWTTVREV